MELVNGPVGFAAPPDRAGVVAQYFFLGLADALRSGECGLVTAGAKGQVIKRRLVSSLRIPLGPLKVSPSLVGPGRTGR